MCLNDLHCRRKADECYEQWLNCIVCPWCYYTCPSVDNLKAKVKKNALQRIKVFKVIFIFFHLMHFMLCMLDKSNIYSCRTNRLQKMFQKSTGLIFISAVFAE